MAAAVRATRFFVVLGDGVFEYFLVEGDFELLGHAMKQLAEFLLSRIAHVDLVRNPPQEGIVDESSSLMVMVKAQITDVVDKMNDYDANAYQGK